MTFTTLINDFLWKSTNIGIFNIFKDYTTTLVVLLYTLVIFFFKSNYYTVLYLIPSLLVITSIAPPIPPIIHNLAYLNLHHWLLMIYTWVALYWRNLLTTLQYLPTVPTLTPDSFWYTSKIKSASVIYTMSTAQHQLYHTNLTPPDLPLAVLNGPSATSTSSFLSLLVKDITSQELLSQTHIYNFQTIILDYTVCHTDLVWTFILFLIILLLTRKTLITY